VTGSNTYSLFSDRATLKTSYSGAGNILRMTTFWNASSPKSSKPSFVFDITLQSWFSLGIMKVRLDSNRIMCDS